MHNKLRTWLALGCALTSIAAAQAAPFDHDDSPVYPKWSHPFDRSINGWANLSMQWLYAQPYNQNPYFDPTGQFCAIGQQGPVWYVAPIFAMNPGSYTRSCSIPRGKAVLLQVAWVADTWPCPNPGFGPPPGQSLYDFLYQDSGTYMMMTSLSVTLDGRPIHDVLKYHYISDSLNSVKGDLSLQSTFDSCITGAYQPVVTNGYFLMFKPLSPGQHTIVRTATSNMGMTNTFTYYLTVP